MLVLFVHFIVMQVTGIKSVIMTCPSERKKNPRLFDKQLNILCSSAVGETMFTNRKSVDKF
jgi:hypothetical protein